MINKLALDEAKKYQIDKYGLIIDRGKFERECQFSPYFYFLSLEGMQDNIVWLDGDRYDVFNVSDDEKREFPDLIDVSIIAQYETNSGFIQTYLDPILE